MNAAPSQTAKFRAVPAAALPPILLFFFASGASGLIYEVIWTRLLLNVFGATLYAVATVLAAFMAGLALGSLLGGAWADRIRRPLRVYGAVEIVVTAAAFSVPWMLDALDPLYHAVYAQGDRSFFSLSLIRFALSFLVLLVPTTCMGATLPLLSRFLVQRGERLGGRIGALYAVNTAGAVAGTFAAGFFLIAALGVHGTILTACGLSLFSGLGAVVLSLRLERDAPRPARDAVATETKTADAAPMPDVRPYVANLVLATYGVSGFIALAYQVFWTRALVFRFEFLKNTTYSFSAMLTVFLVGLSLGSALTSLFIDRQRNPVRLYGLLQVLIGLSGAFSLFALMYIAGAVSIGDPLGEGLDFRWGVAVGNVFARTVVAIGLPTFLMGMTFPVVARICVRRLQAVGAGTGRLYAFNTVGAILGAFAAGFLLIPVFGLTRGLLVLGAGNIALGLAVLFANPDETPRHRMAWSGVALAALVVFFLRIPEENRFQTIDPIHEMIAYEEGPLATVAVVENSIGDRTLTVDNVGVAGTDRILLTDQKSLAHVPMLFLKDPKTALTVGFGSGGASWSYLQHEELERLDCIEISRTVPRMAHTMKASNHGILDEWDGETPLESQTFHEGRYRLIIDDVRSFLQFTDERYDVIATDCTDLRYKSNANLYDVEYFELCREAITEDGMVVVWMPLGGMSRKVFASAMATFAEVFPDMTIWYMNNEPTHYLLLLGTRQPLQIDLDRMLERIERDAVRRDLQEVSLQQPEKILSCFIGAAPAYENAWSDAPLNTENRPYLEFESPKYGYGQRPLLDNLDSLLEGRSDVERYLLDAERHPEFMERLRRFKRAVVHVLAGHARIRRPVPDIPGACKAYLEAQEIAPEDESVAFLLTFYDLRRRLERNPNDVWALVNLAETDLLKKDFGPAADRFNRALEVAKRLEDSPDARAFRKQAALGLARTYLAFGNPQRARQILEREQETFAAGDAYDALLRQAIQALEAPDAPAAP